MNASHHRLKFSSRFAAISGIFCAVAVAAPPAGAASLLPPASTTSAPSDESSTISAQIALLGAANPADRRRAAENLRRIGPRARPAVLIAAHGDDPQIAEEAAEVLRQLPWFAPDDAPTVKQILADYGRSSIPERIGIVTQLSQLPEHQAEPTLLRLLGEDLSDDVSWEIEKLLLAHPQPRTLAAARAFPLLGSRPAALILAARAWLSSQATLFDPGHRPPDRPRALAYLAHAVELETAVPTSDGGQLAFAFDELSAEEVDVGRLDEAARLRRQQCQRLRLSSDAIGTPFFELLSLHAEYGPLNGFQDDLQTYDAYLSQPPALYALGKLYEHLGQTLMAQTLYQSALHASMSGEMRYDVATFLAEHRWIDLAAAETRATLARGNAVPDLFDVRARLRLSTFAVMRGDEADAAEQIRLALEGNKADGHPHGEWVVNQGGIELHGDDAEHAMRIEGALHALHAAKTAAHLDDVDRLVNELVLLGPTDVDAALDLVPELKSRGRGVEADQLFAAAYKPLRDRVSAGDHSPSLLNELAWLSSRCGQKLDEALSFSNEALATDPANPAYLDTNAESLFRVGRAEEAATQESLALKHRPNDIFMQEQLARFKSQKH